MPTPHTRKPRRGANLPQGGTFRNHNHAPERIRRKANHCHHKCNRHRWSWPGSRTGCILSGELHSGPSSLTHSGLTNCANSVQWFSPHFYPSFGDLFAHMVIRQEIAHPTPGIVNTQRARGGLVFYQKRTQVLPRTTAWYFRKIFVIGDDAFRHGSNLRGGKAVFSPRGELLPI